mgnify:CR=1 FL=1
MSLITEARLEEARNIWGAALVAISRAFDEEGIEVARQRANEALDLAYGFHLGPVLFKPTLAGGEQTFRTTREGALSYFIGDDPNYTDPGFGIGSPGDGNYPNLSNRSPWIKCTPEIFAIQVFGNTANAMGWVHFEAADGTTSKVDKTFSYVRDDAGNLRITVHHSSVPYSW